MANIDCRGRSLVHPAPLLTCVFFTFIALWFGGSFPVHAENLTTTIYVGRHFEVRDHEQPVKYVFNGDTRVARVTGSLHSSVRVQRLRLFPGWNLRSLAVTAENLASQINPRPNLIDSAFVWANETVTWQPLIADQTVTAGSIVWLHAAIEASVPIVGQYSEPTNQPIDSLGQFVPGAGLETVDLRAVLSNLPLQSAFTYDTAALRWYASLSGSMQATPELPSFLSPGSALFIRAESSNQVKMTEPSLRVQYYHQDHLGSSSVVTDTDANVVEENSFYPFGAARNRFESRPIAEPFTFTQKESDRESRLHYFEARYLAAPLGRFLGQDLQFVHPDALASTDFETFLSNPQQLNGYAYVRNNPLRFVDPSGRDPKPAQKQKPKALVVYTPDMFADAQKRMKFKDEKSYKEALARTYREEAGPNASITVRSVSNVKALENLVAGSSYETVVIDSHAYLNKAALIIGNEDLTPDDLQRISASARTAPKKFFFYGCNSAKTGFAGKVSGLLPKAAVTGASEQIRQTSSFDKKSKRLIIEEDRSHNKTYSKGGAQVDDARKIDINSSSPLSRENFR